CSRVIVERAVVEPLLERLERRARTLRLGSGLDDGVDVGPLINAAALDKVSSYIDIGRGEGELITGGAAATAGDLAYGNFFAPTIFSGVKPMDRIGQEEIFGPVLSVIPVDDLDAAVTALNQTRYGLSASIFTRDVNTAFRAMRDFEAGIVYVNAGTTGAATHLPMAVGPAAAGAPYIENGTSTWVDTIDYRHIVGRVINDGPTRVEFVEVDVTAYNAANQVIGTDLAFTRLDSIAPGGASSFELVFAEPPGFDHYALAGSFLDAADPGVGGLTVKPGVPYTDGLGFRHFVGEVKNASSWDIEFVEVVVTLLDGGG
ncbi:MAG: aldehyde dehydrogenase family protein, partial [Chloroflexota bacterium]